ncbi:hypothetical protein DAPPUDRAFT_334367 [Daphnia pulex]|uniref:Uncharacterized protein n=1 Tax=Daphnia pulex TaxID=6669 RepID=E9HVE9_DAPPU|nr:hypothetical protein DAPPUDRAFT_334367 [Daphnia pulex]|eukprot:EFX64282.1 hypothetical protein DAPPUDRAFT_334367 [Daphnia pulex]
MQPFSRSLNGYSRSTSTERKKLFVSQYVNPLRLKKFVVLNRTLWYRSYHLLVFGACRAMFCVCQDSRDSSNFPLPTLKIANASTTCVSSGHTSVSESRNNLALYGGYYLLAARWNAELNGVPRQRVAAGFLRSHL